MTEFLKKKFVSKDNIITFDVNDEVTRKVTNFYKDSPFPNYKDNDNKASILEKGDKNFLAAQFKNSLVITKTY